MTAPLRIIVCTKRDLAGSLILNWLLPRLADCTVMVLLSDKTRPVEKAVPELAEMKFLERDLPVDTLFPLLDACGGGDDAPLATFDGVARRFGVPVKVVQKINDADGEALVRDFAPDVMISARFSLIFKANVFDIPRFGTYNVHPGALPRYAGLFAPFRCLVDGGDEIGCTLHRVDAGIDTGPIVGIGWLPVDPARSLLWHVVNTYWGGLQKFVDMLDGLRGGRTVVPLVAQDFSQRVYGSLPSHEQFDVFYAKGFRLFDPQEYNEILAGFLKAGAEMPVGLPGFAPAGEGGTPCCCARA
ncbi:MAG: formyl transferase [Actinomycetota bacterium]